MELQKLIDEADKKNEEMDKELKELDDRDKDKQVLCEEQQRTIQWIEDVRKAMSDGAPIPDKPEEIEILYPSLEIKKKTPEGAPQHEGSPDTTPPPEGCQQDPLLQEAPTSNEKPGDKSEDTVPLEEAVAELCGSHDDERPSVPLEPEVVVVNMPTPSGRDP